MNTGDRPLAATSTPTGAWLPPCGSPADVDELMHRIGQGLQEPLRAAASSLERARRSDAGGDRVALFDHVSELLRVVGALSELVQAWGGGGLDDAESAVALWPLLQEAWAEVEPQAAQREVGIRFSLDVSSPDIATVSGNPRWLRRVLVECLQDAVAATPCGEQLDVLLQQRGQRLCLMLRDDDHGRGGTRSVAAMVLGLCRHVLHQRGGALHETAEGGNRQLVLELPVACDGDGRRLQLLPSAARRYASELAALTAPVHAGERLS